MDVGRALQPELLEDLRRVRLYGPFGDEQGGRDRRVRSTFGQLGQHLSLPIGQDVERVGLALRVHELGNDRRVDDALAVDEPAKRIQQDCRVEDPLLEQVPKPPG